MKQRPDKIHNSCRPPIQDVVVENDVVKQKQEEQHLPSTPPKTMTKTTTTPSQRITACMATYPVRFGVIGQAVQSLLCNQTQPLDEIRIHVNETFINRPPPELQLPNDPRIKLYYYYNNCNCNTNDNDNDDNKEKNNAAASPIFVNNNITDIGKFKVADKIRDGIVFTVDDDILYPPDYIEKMVKAVHCYQGKAIIGVHGCILPTGPPVTTWKQYLEQRRVHSFKRAVAVDLPVNVVGTGTMAYDASQFQFDWKSYLHQQRMVDIHVAVEAQMHGWPMITPARPADWMVPIEHYNGERIWDSVQTNEQMQQAIICRLGDVPHWRLNMVDGNGSITAREKSA